MRKIELVDIDGMVGIVADGQHTNTISWSLGTGLGIVQASGLKILVQQLRDVVQTELYQHTELSKEEVEQVLVLLANRVNTTCAQ